MQRNGRLFSGMQVPFSQYSGMHAKSGPHECRPQANQAIYATWKTIIQNPMITAVHRVIRMPKRAISLGVKALDA